jgi:glutamate--cysteine ligase
VPRLGLKAQIRGRSVLDLARETLSLARKGLAKRGRLDAQGRDETTYLGPLDEIVDRGTTAAELLLEKFHGPWGGSVEPAFDQQAY